MNGISSEELKDIRMRDSYTQIPGIELVSTTATLSPGSHGQANSGPPLFLSE